MHEHTKFVHLNLKKMGKSNEKININTLTSKIEILEKNKDIAIKSQQYLEAAELAGQLNELKTQLKNINS